MSENTRINFVAKVKHLFYGRDEAGEVLSEVDDYTPFILDFDLFLDGVNHANYAVDIYRILSMINQNDEHDYKRYIMWNCSCGEPACAGIEELELIGLATDETLKLRLFLPISSRAFDDENPQTDSYKIWNEKKRVKLLKINKSALIEEFLRLCDEMDELVAHTQGLYVGVSECSSDLPSKPLLSFRSYLQQEIDIYQKNQQTKLSFKP